MTVPARERLFVALDVPDAGTARALASRLAGHVGGFKVGLELYTAAGPSFVEELVRSGSRVFLDLKLHDIPNTVAGAAAAIARLGVDFFTVHAAGGRAMIRAAVEAAGATAKSNSKLPTVLAVTVLTSLDDDELRAIGLAGPSASAVLRLTDLARESGAGGIVCSSLEVAEVRQRFPAGTLVVPGIRPATAGNGDDQRRTATPAAAIARGADVLVVGRPITKVHDPVGAADAIVREIG